MELFRKRCVLCGSKIDKGKEFMSEVKVPEFKGLQKKAFCCGEHASSFKENVKGNPRRSFCPSCPLP